MPQLGFYIALSSAWLPPYPSRTSLPLQLPSPLLSHYPVYNDNVSLSLLHFLSSAITLLNLIYFNLLYVWSYYTRLTTLYLKELCIHSLNHLLFRITKVHNIHKNLINVFSKWMKKWLIFRKYLKIYLILPGFLCFYR